MKNNTYWDHDAYANILHTKGTETSGLAYVKQTFMCERVPDRQTLYLFKLTWYAV